MLYPLYVLNMLGVNKLLKENLRKMCIYSTKQLNMSFHFLACHLQQCGRKYEADEAISSLVGAKRQDA